MNAVSGGEIVVTGVLPRYDGGGGFGGGGGVHDGSGIENGNNFDHVAIGDGGGYTEFFEHICETDRNVDSLAQQVANEINAISDSNEREYGAVIYINDSGELKRSSLTPGQTVAEAIAAGLDAPETRIGIPSDLGSGRILAVIHSHPDVGYSNSQDIDNRYPSNNPGQNGDYQTFNALVASDSRFSNTAEFSQYILGPDGVLREFNASEGVVDRHNDQNPDDRDNLSKDRETCGHENS